MYEAFKRGEERAGHEGATLWGAADNKELVDGFAKEGLVQLHEYPGGKPYIVATLTAAGIDEGRASLAAFYISGERNPDVAHHWLPEWMTYHP